MTFVQIYRQSNSSLDSLCGNTLCLQAAFAKEPKINTGLKESLICMPTELQAKSVSANTVPQPSRLATLKRKEILPNANIVQVNKIDAYGKFNLILPKRLYNIRRRLLIWNELIAIWNSSHNRINGFILNSVNGGFSVAIAGQVAFLPKSLKLRSKTTRNDWRTFAILNMNRHLQNIVVKEVSRRV